MIVRDILMQDPQYYVVRTVTGKGMYNVINTSQRCLRQFVWPKMLTKSKQNIISVLISCNVVRIIDRPVCLLHVQKTNMLYITVYTEL